MKGTPINLLMQYDEIDNQLRDLSAVIEIMGTGLGEVMTGGRYLRRRAALHQQQSQTDPGKFAKDRQRGGSKRMSRQEEVVELIEETMTITEGMSELLTLAQAAAKDGKPMSAATCTAMLELVSAVEIRLDETASLLIAHSVA